MKAFKVYLTAAAENDLEDLFDYIRMHDVDGKAEKVIGQLEDLIAGLASCPERGTIPKELASIGITLYREVRFKPYRIIYQIDTKRVVVMVVADGRRNFQTLLQRRLLAP